MIFRLLVKFGSFFVEGCRKRFTVSHINLHQLVNIMNKSTLTIVCFTCLLLFSGLMAQPALAQVQETDSLWVVVTEDGNEFTGTITEETEEYILLQTEQFGEVKINQETIVSREQVSSDKVKNGVAWTENRYAHKYFISASPFGIEKGKGYYTNYLLFFNQFDYGFTENFSAGIGFIPTFLFGVGDLPFWYSARLHTPIGSEKVNLGFSLQGFGILSGGLAPGNFLSTNLSIGSKSNHVSFGLGYGLIEGNLIDVPLISFNTLQRLGKRSYFMMENYFTVENGEVFGLLSIGGRHAGKRISIDYGITGAFSEGSFFGIPIVGINVPLGH